VPLAQTGGSGHPLAPFSGLTSHRLHPSAPVFEPFPRLLSILLFGEALQHLPLLRISKLVARLNHIPVDVDFLVHHPNVSEFFAHASGVGAAHVIGHVLNLLPVVSYRSHFAPNAWQTGATIPGVAKSIRLAFG
jgi:hypothetical protein